MISITCREMKEMDTYAIDIIGIPSIVLMENAALKVVGNIELEIMDNFTIISGVGNNGGDGLAIARHLLLEGKNIDLFIIGDLSKATKDFNINLNILKNLNINFNHISNVKDLTNLENSLKNNDLTIDSIFGIGLTRNVLGIYAKTITLINEYSKEILSVDIPSGLDGDTGEILGISVKANKTVTFHLGKKGLLKNKDHTGKIIVEKIGIPEIATSTILKNLSF